MKQKWFVGRNIKTGKLVAFKSETTPTNKTHGDTYNYAIGPYRTKRAALFVEKYGEGNPHCVTVNQAEKLAKRKEE